jgi:hypothetical protein
MVETGGDGGEGGILRTSDKHRAILLFFSKFQSGNVFLPSILAYSTGRVLA